MTKLAIPSMSDEGLQSDISAHFGSCEFFTIVNVIDGSINEVKAVGNSTHGAEHNCMAPALLLHENGVDMVLVSGIGGRPLMSLRSKNIRVYGGAFGKVADALIDLSQGSLEELADMGTCNCSHHGE